MQVLAWREYHKETINQIISYLTWRDTKLAIIVFNKNEDSTAVLDQMREVTRDHPNFIQIKDYSRSPGLDALCVRLRIQKPESF